MPKHGYDQMGEGGGAVPGGPGGGGYVNDGGNDSPMSFEEVERPPLRHIDKYVRAECPCIHTTRYTIALMTCLGFIISFGMRCNMGMAKLQFENNGVSIRTILSSCHFGYIISFSTLMSRFLIPRC